MKSKNIQKKELPKYGISVESRVERPDFGSTPHSHDQPSIIFVVSGRGTLEIQNKSHQLYPDCIVPLHKDLPHKFLDKPRKKMTVFSIYFNPELSRSNKYLVDFLFNTSEPLHLQVYYSQQVRKNLRRILNEQSTRPPGYKEAIIQLFNLTLLSVSRSKIETSKNKTSPANPDSSARVRAALNYISENPHEQFSLSNAAAIACVSQRQFTALCRKITGKSFIKFLNTIRCAKAARLIKTTNTTIAAAAFEAGYEELSTFYRAFRSIYNTSPMSLRNS